MNLKIGSEMTQVLNSAPSEFNCTSCKKQIRRYLLANAYSLVCTHCGNIYDCPNGNPVSRNFKLATNFNPAIPVGTEGVVRGRKYRIIAASNKKEKGSDYFWEEYILLNPVHGYAYLSQYEGHWMFLETLNSIPEQLSPGRAYRHDEKEFDIFSKYQSQVQSASGEFPYKLETSEQTSVEEYICPPYILSCEKTNASYGWLLGEYMEPEDVKKAFSLKEVPERSGVGVIQPFLGTVNSGALATLSFIIAFAMIGLQIYFTSSAHDEQVFGGSWYVTDSLFNKEISTASFDLKYGTKNVEIKMSGNLDNSWCYAGITLVNEATGDIYDLDLEAEYYHGYEGGEYWTEGKSTASKIISQVPEGQYHLIIVPQKPTNLSGMNIAVSVIRDANVYSNFFIAFLVLAIFPFYYFNKEGSFERKRWNNSNYSPYANEDNDDE